MQISVQTLLLDLFAILCIISAVAVVTCHNPIHSVVFLILVFCNAAGLLVLLGTEFIAMMFLIIYAGAIAVLFLFVVMMLNIKVAPEGGHKVTAGHMGSWWDNKPGTAWVVAKPYFALVALVVCFVFFFGLAWILIVPGWDSLVVSGAHPLVGLYNDHFGGEAPSWDVQRNWSSLIATNACTNIQSLGYLIYTYYFYYFIMASFILLIAMIGAIVLTMHKRKNASRKQLIFKQIARTFETAVAWSPSDKVRACARGNQ